MMATLGQYGLLWGFRLAREIGERSAEAPFPVRKHARGFAVGYVIYFTAAAALSIQGWGEEPSPILGSAFWLVYLLGVALISYFVWMLTRIAKQLRSISGSTNPRSSTVVILSFFWMASLPLLQSYANKMPNREDGSN